MSKSKKKKRYVVEKRLPKGPYSPEVEAVVPLLFEWMVCPLRGYPDCYTTKKKAEGAIASMTGSWYGWEFRTTQITVRELTGTWRGKPCKVIEVMDG